jgi:hypothetical protein
MTQIDELVTGDWWLATKVSILRKHDNAGAVVIQNLTTFNCMKTNYFKMNWLIPTLGIAVVAGTYLAVTNYLDLERQMEAEQAFVVTVDHVYQAQQLGTALKAIQDGEVKGAVRRLDLLLCNNIFRLDSELASSDARTKALVGMAFQRIAAVRPKTGSGALTSSAREGDDAQAAAEKNITTKVASARSMPAK